MAIRIMGGSGGAVYSKDKDKVNKPGFAQSAERTIRSNETEVVVPVIETPAIEESVVEEVPVVEEVKLDGLYR